MSRPDENTIKPLPDDDEVRSRARAIFASACGNADSYHVLRLGLARRRALHASSRWSMRLWAPLAGGAIACCALVLGVVLTRPQFEAAVPRPDVVAPAPVAAEAQPGSADDLPELGSNQMEMVQDLDFYRWLATQPAMASAASGAGR